jgi:hypothetical protein
MAVSPFVSKLVNVGYAAMPPFVTTLTGMSSLVIELDEQGHVQPPKKNASNPKGFIVKCWKVR